MTPSTVISENSKQPKCPSEKELAITRKSDILGVDAPFMVTVTLKDPDERVGEIVIMPKNRTLFLGYTLPPKGLYLREFVCPHKHAP